MTCPPSWKLNGAPVGCADDGQDSLKTLLVRQFTPTYWATTVSPATSLGPLPLIRVVTLSLLGGVFFGTLTAGAWPVLLDTVGSVPPPCEWAEPLAEAVAGNCWSRSRTQTSVSLPVTPMLELPWVP